MSPRRPQPPAGRAAGARPDVALQPWYVARPWSGMRLGTWFALLRRNRFRIARDRLFRLVLGITFIATINSICAPLQRALFGRRIRATAVRRPIFVIGHWRSGTTLLHELLALDERFTYPDTLQCFAPNDFLVTRWLVTRLGFLIPGHRPMDDMAMGWDLPQEDEFALCNLGVPSPYLTMAFPNEKPAYPEYLDLERLSDPARRAWQAALHRFLQSVAMGDPRPLILKSPPHTARIGTLLELYPDARFVHIVRDPLAVFPSTVRLWTKLSTYCGLQVPTLQGLDELVFSRFEEMYAAFDRQRAAVPAGHLVELRYEDLIRDPAGELAKVYEALSLGSFDGVREKIEEYFDRRRDYRVHTYEPDPERDAAVARRWGPSMRRYGYLAPEPQATGSPA